MTIVERFEELHPASKRLHERASSVFPDGVTHDIRYFTPFPLYVDARQPSRRVASKNGDRRNRAPR